MKFSYEFCAVCERVAVITDFRVTVPICAKSPIEINSKDRRNLNQINNNKLMSSLSLGRH
jgi:hypothetical protein